MLDIAPNEPQVVYASLGQGEKTLLIYNHYDVQPAESLELWDSPPFEPTVRDSKIYGRDVSDDKGHIMCRAQVMQAWQKTIGPLPFKIKPRCRCYPSRYRRRPRGIPDGTRSLSADGHGTPLVNLGAPYPGAKIHAPNENMVLDHYFDALRTMGRFMANFGQV